MSARWRPSARTSNSPPPTRNRRTSSTPRSTTCRTDLACSTGTVRCWCGTTSWSRSSIAPTLASRPACRSKPSSRASPPRSDRWRCAPRWSKQSALACARANTLGHPIGDLLLVAVSERIKECCANVSHIARLGGDEFVVIQRLQAGGTGAPELARQLIESIGKTFEISGHRINIGASIGVALAPRHGMLPDVLLKRADMALYDSKAKGRNTVMVFEDEMDQHAQQRRLLELDIRTAIAERQFSLVFQPIVDMARGEVASFETLIRWRHPTRGNVSPAEFIPVAEETGLIVELGRWVAEEAIRLASAWPGVAAVAINFSAAQFVDKQFPEFLADLLAEFGMPADRVELEITETALLDSSAATLDMLGQFRAMGIRISLDDFGTGYSSLSQLRTFPFNKIKIDGSFVRDLGRSASSIAVIRAVTSIGRILDLTVVGECVESEEQLEALTAAGCNQIQGYLLGKPMPTDAVAGYLADFPAMHARRSAA
ncbi:MAG: bifunctional diguanylate cyclase/phosphodiesterase [Hyphomicrobiales bacterium]|nr:MAG: bifunctional diguanylate cyclase/phosphodiesterase [Hyphomicrobiales bacterium]